MPRSIFAGALALLLSIFIVETTYASGSYGGGGGSFSTSPQPVRQVDPNYERGKAIFTGRQTGIEKVKYCVAVEGEMKPLKRSSLREFKRGTYEKLNDNLYRCDSPETKIAETLSGDDMLYVLYYLNKRYRLYLG